MSKGIADATAMENGVEIFRKAADGVPPFSPEHKELDRETCLRMINGDVAEIGRIDQLIASHEEAERGK
jgi:hypothetical protein